MDPTIATGPSAAADWDFFEARAGQNRPLRVRFLPDITQPQVRYVVPDKPLLAADTAGEPVLSLTLVLSRQPEPEEESIEHLIQQGVVSFDITLALPGVILESLPRDYQTEYRPLFTRRAEFSLLSDEDHSLTLASAVTAGSNVHVALSANLNRDQARAVLGALNGQVSGLQLQAKLQYRSIRPAREIHLSGSWAKIHDFLFNRLGDGGELDGGQLRECFEAMLANGVLTVTGPVADSESQSIGTDCIYQIFVRLGSVILQRLTPELAITSSSNRYTLRGRPHPMFTLDYTERLSGEEEEEVVLTADLADILAGCLEGRAWEPHVRLVVPDAAGGTASNPRRVRSRSQQLLPVRRDTPQCVAMMAINGSVQSVTLAVAPEPRTAATLPAKAFFRPQAGGMLTNRPEKTWLVDDIVLDHYRPADVNNLPVVSNPDVAVWPDNQNRSLYWYAPALVAVQPSMAENADTSPFLFDYEVIGATAKGEPALKASVRFKLTLTQSEEVRRALLKLGNPTARPVTMNNLSVALGVPFVDGYGAARTHSLSATVARQGNTVVATVELLNDWVRLCYGALAIAGFQRQTACLQIRYSFTAFVPLKRSDVELVFGGKTAITPVVYSTAEIRKTGAAVFLDATSGNLHSPVGVLTFKREAAINSGKSIGSTAAVIPVNSGGDHPARVPVPVAATMIASRPQLEVATVLVEENKTKYARRSIVRQESIAAFYPCTTLGAFYREKAAQGVRPIGCCEAFKLGQTTYRQYDEIMELCHTRYRIFRSLQQPGRFLVLPEYYRITRHAPEQETAYQPCAILYSLIEEGNAASGKVVFEACLQPDIAPFEQRALLDSLKNYAQAPVLEYPTQVMSDADYAWTIGTALSEPVVIEWGEAIRLALNVSLSSGLLLQNMLSKAGICGRAVFKLADGSQLSSRLSLDLNTIVGPWGQGPLQINRSSGTIQLINRIEQPVAVTVLHRYQNQTRVESINIDTTLNAGQSHVITGINSSGEFYPVYTQQSDSSITIEERRVFVEDVTTNVVFFVQLNYANYSLQTLEIRVRLKGISGLYSVPLSGDPPVGSINLTLPLTEYLQTHILQFQVTKVFTSGQRTDTVWIDWDLQTQGNVISLTWDLINR